MRGPSSRYGSGAYAWNEHRTLRSPAGASLIVAISLPLAIRREPSRPSALAATARATWHRQGSPGHLGVKSWVVLELR